MSHTNGRPTTHHTRLNGQRVFDVVIASLALVLTLPLALVVALAIVLESGRPVLYRGWRVGQDGEFFRIYKFRSMMVRADRSGAVITTAGDSRVTRVGRILRRTKLDELPQLLNVLRGQMGVVGPRPEHPNYVRLYTQEERRVLGVRPGITGAASVRYRNEEQLLCGDDPESLYRTVVMPAKLRLELEYMERRSLWSDMGLILATVTALPQAPKRAAVGVHELSHGGGPRRSAGSRRRSR
jgi:lipopolysaccharide/colanic/teichoic acid biosynthesis glycosyltransferase